MAQTKAQKLSRKVIQRQRFLGNVERFMTNLAVYDKKCTYDFSNDYKLAYDDFKSHLDDILEQLYSFVFDELLFTKKSIDLSLNYEKS
jgi:hypothetical protein